MFAGAGSVVAPQAKAPATAQRQRAAGAHGEESNREECRQA